MTRSTLRIYLYRFKSNFRISWKVHYQICIWNCIIYDSKFKWNVNPKSQFNWTPIYCDCQFMYVYKFANWFQSLTVVSAIFFLFFSFRLQSGLPPTQIQIRMLYFCQLECVFTKLCNSAHFMFDNQFFIDFFYFYSVFHYVLFSSSIEHSFKFSFSAVVARNDFISITHTTHNSLSYNANEIKKLHWYISGKWMHEINRHTEKNNNNNSGWSSND